LIGEDTYTGVGYQGTISFEQFDPLPVGAIPEPLTVLGVTTATIFGTYFKRKIAAKK
jgi:hypothetical protein